MYTIYKIYEVPILRGGGAPLYNLKILYIYIRYYTSFSYKRYRGHSPPLNMGTSLAHIKYVILIYQIK